jgi:hypothetical protein
VYIFGIFIKIYFYIYFILIHPVVFFFIISEETNKQTNKQKYAVQHIPVMSYHSVLHVCVRMNQHQALLFTKH